MRATSRRIALALSAVVALCCLSSCGGSGPAAGALPTASPVFGGSSTISFPSGGPSTTLQVKILHKGTGPVVQKGQLLVANYVGRIWKGKVFDSSFARHVASAFPIGIKRVIPAWDTGLVGVHAGSRVLLVVPPKDGYGSMGQPEAGITGTDTLVFIVDVIASFSKTTSGPTAGGTLTTTTKGVSVHWVPGKVPTVRVAKGTTAPKGTVVAVLHRGTGPKVRSGLVVMQYLVVSPTTGQLEGSTWTNGQPDGEPAGIPASPSSLDKFVGLPLGTRLLFWTPKSGKNGPYLFVLELAAEPSYLTS
jgi:peptidylprolyl isomerase